MPTPPPDRGHLTTEQRNPRSMDLDQLSVGECVRLLNAEDATVAAAVSAASDRVSAFISAALSRGFGESDGGRLVYVGAGTSGRLGVLDASECPPTFQSPPERVIGLIAGGDAALRKSSEGREDERDGALSELDRLVIGPRDSVLGIAAGATTPYVLGALEWCRARGSLTGLLTCARAETPPFVDHHIVIETGPEVVTGSTRMKAGTATKLVLNTISTTLMVQRGKVFENLMVDLRATNDKLRDRAARIVGMATGLSRDESFALIERANGSCKAAIVMHRAGVSREEAEAALVRASGVLRRALESGG